MKSRMAALALALAGLNTIVGDARAADAGVPQTIDQQGRFLKIDGTPETGSLMVTYALYADTSTTTALWTETQTVALDSSGFYSTQLGAHTAFPSGLWNGAQRYLGITISGESEMTPRTGIVSVPYALVAGDVTGDIHPASITVNGKTIVDSTGTLVVGGAGFPPHPFLSADGTSNGSQIVTDAQAAQINAWAGTPFATWSKCYGFANNAGGNNANFHGACDGQGPIVVVGQITGSGGNLVGGYSTVPFDSVDGYSESPQAFLFTFGSPTAPIAKHYVLSAAQEGYAIYSSSDRVAFGYAHDLYFDLTNSQYYCDFPYDYSCTAGGGRPNYNPNQACTTQLCGTGVPVGATKQNGIYSFEGWVRN